jgi:hypothetical protein
MGKPDIYNPFKSMTREYYFTSGRKIQDFYEKREANDTEYYDIKHKLKKTTEANWNRIKAERAQLAVITDLISSYRDIDVEKAPKTATKYRNTILNEIDKLYEQK